MKEFENFELDVELASRGRKVSGFIKFAQLPSGSWVNIPVIMAIGAKEGPVLLVDGCNHGDEYEGAEGIADAFSNLDVSKMAGALVGIPALNLLAFESMKRYTEVDFVPIDLNRTYPGNVKGTLTQSIADYYLNNFVKKADGLITIHGGGNYLYLEPVTLYQNYGDDISKKSMEMAKAFGFEALWQNSYLNPANGILDEIAYTVKVPTITPEIGGQATRVTSRAQNVKRISDGIINVLRLFKVLDEEVVSFDNQYRVDVEYIYCKNGGIHKPQKKGGERVKKGDTLSIITDIFGTEIERVTCPFDGIVIGLWAYSIIQPRSWSYMVGREIL